MKYIYPEKVNKSKLFLTKPHSAIGTPAFNILHNPVSQQRSMASSPVILYETGECRARNMIPHIINNICRSTRVLGSPLWTLLFSSLHRFSMLFRSVDLGWQKLELVAIKPWPSCSFLADAARFLFKIFWYCMKSMMICFITRFSWLLEGLSAQRSSIILNSWD